MNPIFTCSIDDGHPSDMKTAELLSKHGLNATFFIPIRNREGPQVATPVAIREIGQLFEIGSHTYDHCYLSRLTDAEAVHQVVTGKSALENIIGRAVDGFCYPGGKLRHAHTALVEAAGFAYARTTVNFCFEVGNCPFKLPTTIQFFPHSKAVYISNFLKNRHWEKRYSGLLLALQANNWIDRIFRLFDYSCQNGGIFHLWGHSAEIDEQDRWRELDLFLAYVASRIPLEGRLSNYQLVMRTMGNKARAESCRVSSERPAKPTP